jgi:hypothetical protein
MADKVPIRAAYNSSNSLTGLAQFSSGETIPSAYGGTGSSSTTGALVSLGVTESGTTTVVQKATEASFASQDAKKIILCDLTDLNTMWNYSDFISRARFTSWYQDVGAPPVRGAFFINNSQDKVIWWNIETDAQYMFFEKEANGSFGNNAPSNLTFKDGILYISTAGNLTIVDFLNDSIVQITTSGYTQYSGTISQRNSANGASVVLNSSLAIVNNDVKDVAVVRDSNGSVDEFDRPKHWWVVGTAGGASVYNLTNNAIYDTQNAYSVPAVALSKTGVLLWDRYGDPQSTNIEVRRTIRSVTSDGLWGDFVYNNAGSGGIKLPWANGSEVDALQAIDGFGPNRDPIFVASDTTEGLWVIYPDMSTPANGSMIGVTSDYQTPLMKGTRVAAYPLDAATDRSGNGYNLGAEVGTVVYETGLFSGLDSATFDGDTLLTSSISDLDPGTGDFTVNLWMKTSSATQSGDQTPIYIGNSGQSAYVTGYWNSINSYWTWRLNTGSGNRDLTISSDVYDAKWHMYTFIRKDSVLYAYLDGYQYASAANTDNWTGLTHLRLGGWTSVTNLISASMAMVSVQNTAWSANEIKLEYQRGLRGQGGATPTLSNTSVTSVRADSKSGLAAVSTAANQVEVWDIVNTLRESIDSTTTATLNDADIKLPSGSNNPDYIAARTGGIEFDGQVRRLLG